jgi:hypothetical protein
VCGSRSNPAWADSAPRNPTSANAQDTAADGASVGADKTRSEATSDTTASRVGDGRGEGGVSSRARSDGDGGNDEGEEAQHAETFIDASTTARSGLSKDEQQLVG